MKIIYKKTSKEARVRLSSTSLQYKREYKKFISRWERLKKVLFQNRKTLFWVLSGGVIYVLLKKPVFALAVPVDDEIALVPPKGIRAKFKTIGISVLGLKVYLDPKATIYEKTVAAAKVGCCTTAIALGMAAELSPPATLTKYVLSACCAGSWTAYTALQTPQIKKILFPPK